MATQGRLRWSEGDNTIHGICLEHGGNLKTVFDDIDDLNNVISAISDGRCHVAKEALVFVLVKLDDADHVYSTFPLLAIPIGSLEAKKTIYKT